MSGRRKRRPFGVGFLQNLTAGDYNPIERARRVGRNLMRRNLLGSKPRACCGNYGDPGC